MMNMSNKLKKRRAKKAPWQNKNIDVPQALSLIEILELESSVQILALRISIGL